MPSQSAEAEFSKRTCAVNGITVHLGMVIRSVRHKGLRGLLADNNPRYVNSDLVSRVRKILTVLVLAEDIDSFAADAPRGWRVHRLTGDRRDVWSVSVSGNWRITFKEVDSYIDRLDLEDYH